MSWISCSCVVEYDNGWKTVNLDGPPTHEHEIHDMLHVA